MNIIQKQQQRELDKIQICMDILQNARNELYLSMRFFDVVLHKLELMPDATMQGTMKALFTPRYRQPSMGVMREGSVLPNSLSKRPAGWPQSQKRSLIFMAVTS